MTTGTMEQAAWQRAFASTEAARLTADRKEAPFFESAGFSPRQARALEEAPYWLHRAFGIERLAGPASPAMPSHVIVELAAFYRRGGFTDAQTDVMVRTDAEVWEAGMRQFLPGSPQRSEVGVGAGPTFPALGRAGPAQGIRRVRATLSGLWARLRGRRPH